ncbi:MAG TPA: PLP-dependent aminotransferase family protein, partial [Bacteroidota bacterium]
MLNVQVRREDPAPLYRQIFHQIREMILSGQLPPGHRLPPERRLAEALGVTRATVINAYEELKVQGLVDARVGHGTVVLHAKNPPPVDDGAVRSIAWSHYFRDEGLRPPDPLVRNLLEMATRPDVISLAIGLPSPRHLPVALLRDLMSGTLEEIGPQALLQTPTEGLLSLRDALSRWLTKRGIACSAEDLLILSGSQQGLHLAARIFLNPGDTIIVEAPTYFGAKEAFRRAGARLISVETDDDGMQVDRLAALLQHHRPKLIYTLPTFQNPSGAVLSLERRRRLLQLASSYGIPILEDDTYTELRYDGPLLPPLKALDNAGIVLSLGTFSKILFPGLRLGWLVAPR